MSIQIKEKYQLNIPSDLYDFYFNGEDLIIHSSNNNTLRILDLNMCSITSHPIEVRTNFFSFAVISNVLYMLRGGGGSLIELSALNKIDKKQIDLSEFFNDCFFRSFVVKSNKEIITYECLSGSFVVLDKDLKLERIIKYSENIEFVSLHIDKKDKIYLSFKRSIHILDENLILTEVIHCDHYINSICVNSGKIIAATDDGLFVYEDSKFKKICDEKFLHVFFDNNKLICYNNYDAKINFYITC